MRSIRSGYIQLRLSEFNILGGEGFAHHTLIATGSCLPTL